MMKHKKRMLFFSIGCVVVLLIGVIIICAPDIHDMDDKPIYQSAVFSEINPIGNANYFNPKDGIYYEDALFKKKANDNTGFLLSLLQDEKPVVIPEGNYLCSARLILKGKNVCIRGTGDKTKIVFDSKGFKNDRRGAFSEALVVNENLEGVYDDNTAQNITLDNLLFEYKRFSSRAPKTNLLLSNTASVKIDNCTFIADLQNHLEVTNLDLYNGCKNVTVSNCTFINETQANGGRCICIRNLTAAAKRMDGNTTENVTIKNSTFRKDSKDEVIAVFSNVGDVNNVSIHQCHITDSSEKNEVVLSAYSSSYNHYGKVFDVTFSENTIDAKYFKSFLFMIGREDSDKTTDEVTICNNIIHTGDSRSRRYIINNNDYLKGNNFSSAIGNTIQMYHSSKAAGVGHIHYSRGNIIEGVYDTGIIGGESVDNKVSGARVGLLSPHLAQNNDIVDCSIGILVDSIESRLTNNKITLNHEKGVCGIEIKRAPEQRSSLCSGNKINTFTKEQYGFIIHNGSILLEDNAVIGIGNEIYTAEEVSLTRKQ